MRIAVLRFASVYHLQSASLWLLGNVYKYPCLPSEGKEVLLPAPRASITTACILKDRVFYLEVSNMTTHLLMKVYRSDIESALKLQSYITDLFLA